MLCAHRGILVLLSVLASAGTGRTGAAETAKFALECLDILTLATAALTETCLVGGSRAQGCDPFVF
jgi:hypothetical protein